MIGLFVNTLPLRVTVVEEASLIPWLKKLQVDALKIRRYEAIPLPQISAWSEIAPGMPLFDSVVIFQNLPFTENLAWRARRLGIESARYREKTHYPLALTAIPGTKLVLTINIDARCFDIGPCERMLAHFANLLEAITDDAERRLVELPLVSKEEQEQLLGQWSHAELMNQEPGHDVDQLSEEELDALLLGWAQNQGENHEPSR
jgi:non-ribosomal peptide synthetase component F